MIGNISAEKVFYIFMRFTFKEFWKSDESIDYFNKIIDFIQENWIAYYYKGRIINRII